MTPEQHAQAIEDAANRLISLASGICTAEQALNARRALQSAIRAGVGANHFPDAREMVGAVPEPLYFSDFNEIFQDAEGTIPVTEVGQPVGRIACKTQAVPEGWRDSVTVRVSRGQSSIEQTFTDDALREAVDRKALLGAQIGLMIAMLEAAPKP